MLDEAWWNDTHPDVERFIVDDRGKIIRRYSRKRKVKYQPPRPYIPRPPPMNLPKLEDAIFSDSAFRVLFLNKMVDLERSGEREVLNSIKHDMLEHCWKDLGWRPKPTGSKVYIKHPNNNYV